MNLNDRSANGQTGRRERRLGDDPAPVWRSATPEVDESGDLDQRRIADAQARIESGFEKLLAAGVAPTEESAREMAERARRHIDGNHYPCTHETHLKVAEMYESDPRFRARLTERRKGLASYIARAIRANGERRSERS